jgi:hypothetical protein
MTDRHRPNQKACLHCCLLQASMIDCCWEPSRRQTSAMMKGRVLWAWVNLLLVQVQEQHLLQA